MTKVSSVLFLARRNMRQRKGRTALTVLGIVLGVAVVLAIQITNQTTLDSLRRIFDRTTGQASLMITPFNENEKALEADLLGRVRKYASVEVAAPCLRAQTLLASESSSWQLALSFTGVAEGNLFQVYGIDPELDAQVRVYVLSDGRLPKPEKYEAAIPEKTAAEKGLQIGDDLAILTPEGTAKLEIVGLLAGEGVALLNDGAVAFVSLDVAQDLFQRGGELDEIALKIDPQISEDPRALGELKNELSKRVGKEGRVVYPASRGQLVSQMLATYQLGLTFFSMIAIFVGGFLIYNAFSMTVVERTREIGMLRAIGMNRWQILGMVLAEAVLLSAIGSLLGVGAGVLLARGLIGLMGNLVTAESGAISIPWQGLLQSLGVGVGVTLIAACLPAFKAARISPLEALRVRSRSSERANPITWLAGLGLVFTGWAITYQIQWPDEVIFLMGNLALVCTFLGATLTVTGAIGWLERLTRPLARAIYGKEGAIGSANVRRSVGRTTLTVASLMVALTMIISISSVAVAFEQDLSAWIESALGGDLYVRSAVTMRESFGRQLENVPGVAVVTPARVLVVRAAPGTLHSDSEIDDKFYYTAIDPATYRQIADMEFAANQGDPEANWAELAQGKAVFISSSAAERYGLQQGDKLALLTSRGKQSFTIAAEVLDFGGQGQTIYGSYADLQRWFGKQGVDRFTLSVAEGCSVDAVAEEIEARYQDRYPISIQTTEAFKKSILGMVDQAFRLFDVLSLIGVIIGALGVINTLTMNVIERQREIGGMRSLGMTRGQVLRMVLAEALTMGLMGGIYGLAAGWGIAHMLILGLNLMVGYDLAYLFTPEPFITGILIAVGVVQLAAIYPAKRAAKVNIVEAVKHE